ncbi:MAG TPA: valine--tRNA ligase [Thermodesulfobacteriota bacterium]|nr:valine--tRNA ligase [Thermodesulfobacteriota bacterium]
MEETSRAEIEKIYDHRKVEAKWYDFWIRNNYFSSSTTSKKPPFSIVIPPPNVTGSLHIGHALNNTLQDILIRYKRMKGFDALWVPGTDHAGIATQMVVERQLEKQGISRHKLGRAAFVERVWKWKAESGGTIIRQLRRLGASPDWGKERFTMDEGLSKAVRKVFVDLYKQGLIYRDKRLVNWDCKLHTAISDLEVQQREVKGFLWHIKYPIEGMDNQYITVATTRPETMLGDTAVAVHPEDSRYTNLVGKYVILPLVGSRIPIIADTYSDPTKGSGAVKITPAHDFNDFEVGKRHGLEMINIFDEDAKLNDNVPETYRGLDRYEARKRIVTDLEAQGLLEKIEEYVLVMPYGDRSGVVIEPWLTDQWYVDAAKLAKPAVEAVEQGRTRFVPKYWENTFFEWMNNIQPWCISRQIWWGHQIPAWYGPDGEIFVEMTEEEARKAAKRHYGKDVELKADEDVLDTWFSSSLWPFSTLGWSEHTPELERYYPTSVLVTGFDIIFFWVARMMMMGLKFMGEVPFKDVYIHALVRDEKGEKMSKSKGNVIDPLQIMDEYGADTLRFTLTALAAQGRDIKLSVSIIEGYRNFMNKIWNASRFVFMNLDGYDEELPNQINLTTPDKWILAKLNRTIKEAEEALHGYEFDKAARTVYQFIWADFCDWYIELVKPMLTGNDPDARKRTQAVLVKVLLSSLQLLHPVAPFITEEIYQRLREFGGRLPSVDGEDAESIVISSYPTVDESETYEEAYQEMEFVKEVIVAIRNLRATVGLHPSARVDRIIVIPDSNTVIEKIKANKDLILNLAKVSEIDFSQKEKPKKAIAQVISGTQIFLPVEGLIDVEREVERINKEIAKVVKDIESSKKKLSNPDFLSRAPEEVVEKEKEKFEELSLRKQRMEEVLERLSEIG